MYRNYKVFMRYNAESIYPYKVCKVKKHRFLFWTWESEASIRGFSKRDDCEKAIKEHNELNHFN